MEEKYVIIYKQDSVSIEPCVNGCRDYNCIEHGCQNQTTLEEASEACAIWHDQQAKSWRDGTHSTIVWYKGE